MERTIRTGQVRTVRLKTVRYAMAAFPLPIADSSQVSVLLLLLVSVAIGRKKFSILKLLTSAVKRTELMIKGEREGGKQGPFQTAAHVVQQQQWHF